MKTCCGRPIWFTQKWGAFVRPIIIQWKQLVVLINTKAATSELIILRFVLHLIMRYILEHNVVCCQKGRLRYRTPVFRHGWDCEILIFWTIHIIPWMAGGQVCVIIRRHHEYTATLHKQGHRIHRAP